MTEQQVKKKVT